MTDLPYQTEYAKSGRAACKGCKEKIDQACLRIAVMVQSAFHDGKQPNWYHKDCFFKKQRPGSVNDIANFNKLRLEDQKSIKETIESATGMVLPVEKGKGKAKKSSKRGNTDSSALAVIKDFAVEYSKSSRATCRHCDIKICKGEVRISKTVFDTDVGKKFGGQPLWHHVNCFAEERNSLLYMAGGEDLPGFKSLSKDDQKIVKDAIKPLSPEEIPVKKLKQEPKDEVELKEEKKREKEYENQNKLFFKHRDALSNYSKDDLNLLLEENSQTVPSGIDEIRDRVADLMAFGALKRCPECQQGQLTLDNFGYKCTGNLSEWTKCKYVTQNPQRVAMKIPKDFKKRSPFTSYKAKVGVRLFQAAPPAATVVKQESLDVAKKETPVPPLKNLEFFIYGRLKGNKDEIKNRILKMGGKVVSKLTDTIAAVISTNSEVEKMSSKMTEIKQKFIEVVEESYLDLIDKNGTVASSLKLIIENNVAPWKSDPLGRVPQDVVDGKSAPKSGSIYTKSAKSGITQIKIKGGSAVDPDSGLDKEAHVYHETDGTKYTVVLGRTDVVDQKNSYYKLQLLESDAGRNYWLFRSWGRIGTTIGGTKVETCRSLHDALRKFRQLYREKTENPWENRENFVKAPGGYYPIDMDYGESDPATNLQVDDKCKLAMPVQHLIAKIFDINIMKRMLMEFELDTEKMPLGKLSKKQIKSGYSVLTELLNIIEKGGSSQSKIIDATNRFYTLIPHDFGVDNPPLLDNIETIKTKCSMLDNLLEVEIAYNLLKTDDDDNKEMVPIEAHYLKLKADIAPLDCDSPEFQMIKTYVKNTHAATHSGYSLEIEQLFKVVREGEDKRFKPFRKLHNRRLLWHGSRTTNFAGILSQGLRIAPPEAPVTGYMFGKGIYFADMVSKSANYCCTSIQDSTGLLLLCEVALGEMKQCLNSEYIEKLPNGLHSTWGMGRSMPNPDENHVLDCGTIVPLGKPITKQSQGSLLYNEFIVYDVAQVNVKYLIQLKFLYKY